MNTKLRSILALLLIFAPVAARAENGASAPVEVYTLDRAVKSALNNNAHIQNAEQNIIIAHDDVIVVTELYPMDTVPHAREWGPIAEFISGRINRSQMITAIENQRPSWPPVRKP